MDIFFFDQDNDSHWYMVPSKLRDQWDSLSDYGDDEDKIEAFSNVFDAYMLGGGIQHIDFMPVKIEKL